MVSEGPFLLPEASMFSPVHILFVSAAVRNHTGNITLDQNQVGFSTLASKEGVKLQTPVQSHAPSAAPENPTPHAETAGAGGTNRAARRTKANTSPAGPERATALPSPSSPSGECVLTTPTSRRPSPRKRFLPVFSLLPGPRYHRGVLVGIRPLTWAVPGLPEVN